MKKTQIKSLMLALAAFHVDPELCLQCHQPEAKQWAASHHAKAMAIASDASVLGNFNNSTFIKRDNQYYIHTQGSNGKWADYKIKYTFGVDPLQQYLIELPNGHLQNFTIAFDVHHGKWFDLYPHEKAPPGDILHWSGRYQNANSMCITCHTTDYQKNYASKTDSYTSSWSEINVGCQACHGPGSNHVKWAKDKVGDHKGLVVDFKSSGANSIIETCGICHSRRSEISAHPLAGEPLMNNYLPTLLSPGLYYPDGQQEAEVYIYNSFRQSKMYQMGVSCIDCHNPHTGQLKREGNAVCTQCHSTQGDKRFPTAAKLYDDPSHTHHRLGSTGAQCVNCHMPAKKYMIINSRPDHSIRIPRPDLSMKLGTPNACTTCHTNKSAKWAQEWITKWYGKKTSSKTHYGEILAAGREGKAHAEENLVILANDVSEPAIVRATALDLLSHYSDESISTSIKNLHDNDPAIRRAAITGIEKLTPSARLSYLAPLLTDPIRAVRMEAVRMLAQTPDHLFDEDTRKIFQAALTEYIAIQELTQDMPASNLNLAVLYENIGHFDQAENYYHQALRLDPAFTPARLNLARLYNRLNQNDHAEKILQDGIQLTPNEGELYYSLGLLLAEEKRIPEAAKALEHAVKLLPNRPRVRYNYEAALQLMQQNPL